MAELSRRGYAASRNISEAAVRKHIASGVLADAVLANGLIDSDAADRLLATELTRPKAAKRLPAALRAAKHRRLRAQVRALNDEVNELKRTLIAPADAAKLTAYLNGYIFAALRRLPDIASQVAGQPGTVAYRLLDDGVQDCLQYFQDHLPPLPDVQPAPELDLDPMTHVQLTTLQANLQAEKLELERLLARGELAVFSQLHEDDVEKLTVSKSIYLAIPGRLAPMLAAASVEDARGMIGRAVEQALAVLGYATDADPFKLTA